MNGSTHRMNDTSSSPMPRNGVLNSRLPVNLAERCQTFPECPLGLLCPFKHPKCRYELECEVRNCPYSHPPVPENELSELCKFYPQCKNPACRFIHMKACRYGKNCRKSTCKFYHDPRPGLYPFRNICQPR